jgi:hypothetical protein
MRWEQERKQRLYNETAGVIMSYLSRSKITTEEMHLLLNLLEEIAVSRKFPELLPALGRWQETELEPGLDEIITATLIAIDFKQEEDITRLVRMIDDFIPPDPR